MLLALLFPRFCIGCDRDDVLLCAACARRAGESQTLRLDGLCVYSCFPYAGAVRGAITEFKHGRRAFASDLAALLLPSVPRDALLVPVPTTRGRRAARGFDQTVLLARVLERSGRIRVAELLARKGERAQQGRSRTERIAATGRFCLQRGVRASGEGMILFDDVRTTGATLIDAARTLADAGCNVRGALTLAWTPKERW